MQAKNCSNHNDRIRDIERRQIELEELILQFIEGDSIDANSFLERVKEIDARLDLRRAGEVLNPI